MKRFNVLAVLSLVVAALGILITGGEANLVSYTACLPLLSFVILLIASGIRGSLKKPVTSAPEPIIPEPIIPEPIVQLPVVGPSKTDEIA